MTESSKKLPCWIDGWLEYTEGLQLPRIIRLWAGLAAFAGLLERRVYHVTVRGPVYPNLFVLLVTPPGIGKSLVIDPIERMWQGTKKLFVAPHNMTKASFMDDLQAAHRIEQYGAEILDYHSLNIAASEFGVLCPAHDMEYLSVLTRIYDCGDVHRESRRGMKGEQIEIARPHINLVAGTQPDYLAQFLPEAAWGQGFMSRVLMIYSDEVMTFDMWGERPKVDPLRIALTEGATRALGAHGYLPMSEDGKDAIRAWLAAGSVPAPTHLKLKNYSVRRPLYVLKLSIISALARGHAQIELRDVERAFAWLFEAEKAMPDVFKALKGNSDHAVLQELKLFVADEYMRTGKSVHEQRIVNFLYDRTPSGNIPRLIEIATKGGLIKQITGTLSYQPDLTELGPET